MVPRFGELRAAGFHGQFDGRLTTPGDGSSGLGNPVVERVRFVEAWAVLLDAPSPDVLIGIQVERGLPVLDSTLEIRRLPMVRVVTFSEGDSEPEVGGAMVGIGFDEVLIGVDRVTNPFGSAPYRELVCVPFQVSYGFAFRGGF